jgi:hypothetical protein
LETFFLPKLIGILTLLITFNKWRLQIGQSNWAKMTNATPTGLNIQIRICLDPLIFDLLGPEPDLRVKIAPQF